MAKDDGGSTITPVVDDHANHRRPIGTASTLRSSIVAVQLRRKSRASIHSAESLHESGAIPFYSPPVQRQRWDDEQVLPHINWGDLFFDLFFVAAAYNLGSFLVSMVDDSGEMWSRGVLYFVGMFGALMMVWANKTRYDAKYTVVDYSHRMFDTMRMCFLGLSIMHIESVDVMSDSTNTSTFNFCLGLLLEKLMQGILYLELWLKGEGEMAMHTEARVWLTRNWIPTTLFYSAATCVAGVNSYGTSSNTSSIANKHARFLTATAVEGSSYGENFSDGNKWGVGDVPLILLLSCYIFFQVANLCWIQFFLPTNGEHKKVTVPMNVDFSIHRQGEWIMLMLGESILSLLTAEIVETTAYYIIAFVGIITVIMMQSLHFESEPSQADGHAMRRNKTAGCLYYVVIHIYSMALVAVGASYKVMLNIIVYAYNYPPSDSSYTSTNSEDDGHRYSRFLAGSSIDDSTETKQTTARLFSIALMLALLSLEFMSLFHKGLSNNFKRATDADCDRPYRRQFSMLFVLIKVALLVVTGTLFLWLTEPQQVTIAGGILVLFMFCTKIVGWHLFNA